MRRTRRPALIRRLVILAAATTGILAAMGTAAQAYAGHQHCEPLVRR